MCRLPPGVRGGVGGVGGSRDVGKNLEEEKKISMVICEVHWISLKWLLDYSIDL
jgi:hypothetical protein